MEVTGTEDGREALADWAGADAETVGTEDGWAGTDAACGFTVFAASSAICFAF